MTDLVNKLRGGYYTPGEVARFICDWAIRSGDATVLEPSCGDGSFVEAAVNRLEELGAHDASCLVTGVELYEEEARKAAEEGGHIVCGDFFTQCRDGIGSKRYDAIIGNPPFIRYQDFEEEYRSVAFDLMRGYGFAPNRLTNIWLPFLVVCCHLLSDGGRLGMVIPAELFQVKYAAETRHFLMKQFDSVTVVTFSELLFDDAQQEVVLLLLERRASDSGAGVRIIEEVNARSLAQLDRKAIESTRPKRKLPESMKWQAYYLDNAVLDLLADLDGHRGVKTSAELFEVNVGVVSGQNSFFVIDRETATRNHIEEACTPIISRSFQLSGLALTDEDFEQQLVMRRKVLLFLPDGELTKDEANYVKLGEAKGFDGNFKCRIRNPWYRVPTSWKPDAFFYRQVGAYPRIVINEKRAHTTDTLHKLRFVDGVDGKSVAVAFNNSLTFLMSELTGRSYGGGVLTFEPSEARSLPIPFGSGIAFDFERADELVRAGKTDELISYVDSVVLGEYLGLASHDITLLHNGWLMLRDRRLARKKR
ncbi:MAG: N-6 DNA methylase [Coriobacteriales bacterium]|jgi:adenine-specific DNA-methyltransferase